MIVLYCRACINIAYISYIKEEGYMGAYSKRLSLWLCISALSIVLVGLMVSCVADAERF